MREERERGEVGSRRGRGEKGQEVGGEGRVTEKGGGDGEGLNKYIEVHSSYSTSEPTSLTVQPINHTLRALNCLP